MGAIGLPDGIALTADGDAVENLTVRHFAVNGVLVGDAGAYGKAMTVAGYRVAYVTAYDNGLYGLYAFGDDSGRTRVHWS